MQTIAVINKKGGTGKTTTAVNLGVALAKAGSRVLVIDLDPQGSLSYSLGIYKVNYDIANALIGEVRLSQTIVKREGLDVVPATLDLQKVEVAMANFHRREEVLKSMLAEVPDYDYAIIDCPPGNHIMQMNALIAANWVIVPMQIQTLNIKGLLQIEKEIEDVRKLHNPRLKMLGVLPVARSQQRRGFFGNRIHYPEKLQNHMRDKLGIRFMKSVIREDEHIQEAPGHGHSVLQFAPNSIGAKDYQELGAEVLKRTRKKMLTTA